MLFKNSRRPILLAAMVSLCLHICFFLALLGFQHSIPKFGISYAAKQGQRKDRLLKANKNNADPLYINTLYGLRARPQTGSKHHMDVVPNGELRKTPSKDPFVSIFRVPLKMRLSQNPMEGGLGRVLGGDSQEQQAGFQSKKSPFSSSKVKNINHAIQNQILYPRLAVRMAWEGKLSIKVKVAPDGTVKKTSIIKSTGFQILDQAAVNAVHKWKFEKALEGSVFPLHFAFELR